MVLIVNIDYCKYRYITKKMSFFLFCQIFSLNITFWVQVHVNMLVFVNMPVLSKSRDINMPVEIFNHIKKEYMACLCTLACAHAPLKLLCDLGGKKGYVPYILSWNVFHQVSPSVSVYNLKILRKMVTPKFLSSRNLKYR